jgi:hypothetical protein
MSLEKGMMAPVRDNVGIQRGLGKGGYLKTVPGGLTLRPDPTACQSSD